VFRWEDIYRRGQTGDVATLQTPRAHMLSLHRFTFMVVLCGKVQHALITILGSVTDWYEVIKHPPAGDKLLNCRRDCSKAITYTKLGNKKIIL
jgi:hypothetical protein